MTETELLSEIFEGGNLWKAKYKITWCELCSCAIIVCPICKHGSCSGGGCDECVSDFVEFGKLKTSVTDYLTEEETKTYWKCMELKKFVLESFRENETEINFKNLQKLGKLSQWNEEMFKDKLDTDSTEQEMLSIEKQMCRDAEREFDQAFIDKLKKMDV